MNRNLKYIAAFALSSFASLSVAGGYVGASVGQTDVKMSGFDNGTSIALSGGYKFHENFAVEASYINLGDTDDNIAPTWTLEADGFNFSAVGILPVVENVDAFAKVGAFMWDVALDESGYGQRDKDSGTDLSYGLGASITITEQFSAVIEYQGFNVYDENFSNISLGARFNF